MSGTILSPFLDLLSHLIGSIVKVQVEEKFDFFFSHITVLADELVDRACYELMNVKSFSKL